MIVFLCTDKGGTSCSGSITSYSSADVKSGCRPRQDVSTNKSICKVYAYHSSPSVTCSTSYFQWETLKNEWQMTFIHLLHLLTVLMKNQAYLLTLTNRNFLDALPFLLLSHHLSSILHCFQVHAFLGHGFSRLHLDFCAASSDI